MTKRDENTVIYKSVSGVKYFMGLDKKERELKAGDIVSDMSSLELKRSDYPHCIFKVIEVKNDEIVLEKLEGNGYMPEKNGYFSFYGTSDMGWNLLEPEYKEVGSFHFKRQTPDRVCEIVNNLYESGVRARFFFGDSDGQGWLEMSDNIGTIGRSTGGKYNVPLLMTRRGHLGGKVLMSDKIVRITVDKQDVYRHEFYHTDVVLHGNIVEKQNGEIIYDGGDEVKAGKVYEYLLGVRNKA